MQKWNRVVTSGQVPSASRPSPFLGPPLLTVMLVLSLGMVCLTMALQHRAALAHLPPVRAQMLDLDDYVLGVVHTLGGSSGELRLTPSQAQRLLRLAPLVRREMVGQAVGTVSARRLFRVTLTREQRAAIQEAPWWNAPRVVDPESAFASYLELLKRVAGDT